MKKLFLMLFLLLSSIQGFSQQNVLTKHSTNMEHNSIIQAITNIFEGSDERNWAKVEAAMAGQVLLDYTSMAGGSPATLTPGQITTSWKTILPGFQSTHHQIGNFTVDQQGQEAKVNFHGLALHYLPNKSGNDYWTVVGTYDYHLIKNKEGKWIADKIKFNLQKQEGNLELPLLAGQHVKEGATFEKMSVTDGARKAVEAFFTSLERLDIESFLKVWADNGTQLMPLAPENFPSLLEGKEAIYKQYKGLPDNFSSMKFPRKISPTEDPNKVIVRYRGLIPLKAGGEYNNNYVGVFEIKDGKLQRFIEYFDPFILQEAFGKKLQSNFNVNTNK